MDIEYLDQNYDDYAGSTGELDEFAVCYEEGTITLKGIAEGLVTIGDWTLSTGDDALSGTDDISSVVLNLDDATINAGNTEFGSPSNHTITYTHQDANTCQKDVNIAITINPRPTLDIVFDDGITSIEGEEICYDDVVTLIGLQENTEADGAAGTLSWSVNTAGLGINVDLDRRDFTASLAANQTGAGELDAATAHNITFGFVDLLGCSSSVTSMVIVNPLPDISIDIPSGETTVGEYCSSNEIISLQGQIEGVNVSSGVSAFTLSSGVSGISDGGNGTATFNPNVAHLLTDDDGNVGTLVGGSPSYHTTSFTHTDDNGCTNTVDEELIVNPLPAISLTSTESNFSDVNFAVCASNDAFIIDAEFSGFQADTSRFYINTIPVYPVAGSLTKVTFNPEVWASGEDTEEEETYSVDDAAAALIQRIKALSTGISADYTIRYELDDVRGCSNSTEKELTIYDRPEMDFVIVGGCVDPEVQYYGGVDTLNSRYDEQVGLTLSYQWEWVSQSTGAMEPLYDGESDNIQNPTKLFVLSSDKSSDIYEVTLEGTYEFTRADGVVGACVSLPFVKESDVQISPTISFTWDTFVAGITSSIYPNEIILADSSIVEIQMDYGLGTSTVEYDIGTDVTIDVLTNEPLVTELSAISYTYDVAGKYDVSMTMITEGTCESTLTREINVLPVISVTDQYLADFGGDFDPDTDGWYAETLVDDAILYSLVDPDLNDGVDEFIDQGLREHSWVWGEYDFSNLSIESVSGDVTINVTDKPTNSANNFMWATLNADGDTTNNYRQGEDSWVYSPVFDVSELDKPMLSMNILHDFENPKDGAVIQYSTDTLGQEWYVLGYTDEVDSETLELQSEGLDWYDSDNVGADPGQQQILDNTLATSLGWSGRFDEDQYTWKIARHGLDEIPDSTRGFVRFRIAMAATDDGDDQKGHFGFAFDDFVIRSRNKNVLIEEFYVVSDDEGADDFNNDTESINTAIENIVGDDDSQIRLAYHINLDNDITDPFNAVNTADPAARKSWYNLETVTSVLDGQVSSLADDGILTWSARDLRLSSLEDPGFNITIEADASAADTEVKGTASFEVNDISGIAAGTELIAYMAIIEDSIAMEIGGLEYHTHVLRKLLPDASGQFIELNSEYEFGNSIPIGSNTDTDGDEETMDIQWDISSITNAENLAAVVFIQNRQTKEIYQAVQVDAFTDNSIVGGKSDAFEDVLSLEDPMTDTSFEMYPNPSDGTVTIKLNTEVQESVEWTLYDHTGRVFDYGRVDANMNLFEIETNDFPNGMYYMQIRGDQFKLDHKKLMILHR